MASSEENKSALERVTLVHSLYIGALTVLLILISICIVRYRHMKRMRGLKAIPRDRVPVSRDDVPKKQATIIAAATERAQTTSSPPLVPPEGFLGWGQPDSDYAEVHFKTSIAKSFQVLEAAVVNRHPAAFRPGNMSIAEYMEFLRSSTEGIPHELMTWYVAIYHRARFSVDDFSLADYKAFISSFYAIIAAVDPPRFVLPPHTLPPFRLSLLPLDGEESGPPNASATT